MCFLCFVFAIQKKNDKLWFWQIIWLEENKNPRRSLVIIFQQRLSFSFWEPRRTRTGNWQVFGQVQALLLCSCVFEWRTVLRVASGGWWEQARASTRLQSCLASHLLPPSSISTSPLCRSFQIMSGFLLRFCQCYCYSARLDLIGRKIPRMRSYFYSMWKKYHNFFE